MDTDSAVLAKKELQGITFLFAFYVILTSSFSANPENCSSASRALYEKLALVNSAQHSNCFTNNDEFHQPISGVLALRKELETLKCSSCEKQKEFTIRNEIIKESKGATNNNKEYSAIQTEKQFLYESFSKQKARSIGTAKCMHVGKAKTKNSNVAAN